MLGIIRRTWWAGLGVLAVGLAGPPGTQGQGTAMTLDDLARMSAPELDALYAGGSAPPIPDGRVEGRALYPGRSMALARSRAARLAWQGKVFDRANAVAVNRFFGVRSVRGRLYHGVSWRDGAPSLILDYEGTSRIYANYRDEIRRVGPGLYLGLMYDRTTSPPASKMYFALSGCE